MRRVTVLRRVMILLVLAATALAACTPVKTGPVPGRSIAYYYIQDLTLPDPTDAFRSATPFSRAVNGGMGTAQQTLNSQGQVLLEIINAGCPCEATSGFYTPLIPLSSLDNVVVRITPGGTDVQVSLIIDQSGNGEWAEWDANGQRTSFGGDDLGFGPFTQGGQVVINDNREFELSEAPGNPILTLAELKAGAEPGIDGNTPVGILVETLGFFTGDATSIVTQILVNGIQVLP
jgi:hypothetical protein